MSELGQQVAWEPFAKQARALSCNAMEIHYGGAAGGGKSETLLIKALSLVKNLGARCLLLRRKIVDLQKLGAIIDRSKTLYRGRGKYNDQKKRWTFTGNSSIEFGHCQSTKDLDNYYSAQYDFIGIDQVEQFTQDMYTFFFSRLRTTNPALTPQIMSGSNPVGIGRGWIKKRFWINEREPNKAYPITEEVVYPDGTKKAMTYYRAFIPSRVWDNPHIMKNDPMYLLRLQQLPEEKKKALLDGDWNAFEGAFFSEWSETRHVCESFPIPSHWKRSVSFDWGYSDPTCVLWYAEDNTTGQIYVYRELKVQRTLDIDVMRLIHDLSKNEEIYCIYYPWDLDRVDDQTGVSKKERMQTVWRDLTGETPYMKVGVNNRAEGWDAVRYMMGMRSDGQPRMRVFKNCQYLIDTIPNQIHDDNNPEDLNCFVAGTKVLSPNGSINIENIKTGDFVCTPVGDRKVLLAGISGYSKTCLIHLSNGTVLEGTPNHEVYVKNKGMVELQYLNSSDILIDRNTSKLWELKPSYTKALLTPGVMVGATISRMGHFCQKDIWLYISRFILTLLGQFQGDIISTIRTLTKTIIPQTILSPCLPQVMPHSMGNSNFPSLRLEKEYTPGLRRKKERVSFETTPGKCEKELPSENLRALIVKKLLKRDIKDKNTVTNNAKKRTISIFLQRFAQFVTKNLCSVTATQDQSQPVRIVAVGHSDALKPVYNLTVEQSHLYYANGVLVSNTDGDDHGVDALRYFALTYRNFYEKPGEKPMDRRLLPVDVGAAVKVGKEYRFKSQESKVPVFAWLGE